LVGQFFSWWYTEAISGVFAYLKRLFVYVFDLFSIKICLTTLFSPWRRDNISYRNLSIPEIFQAWTLNLASRFVGLIVKLIVIASYSLVLLLQTATSATIFLVVIAWPALIITLLIHGISKVFS
jgi:hypothetical protein